MFVYYPLVCFSEVIKINVQQVFCSFHINVYIICINTQLDFTGGLSATKFFMISFYNIVTQL